jgi:hypothetical protein
VNDYLNVGVNLDDLVLALLLELLQRIVLDGIPQVVHDLILIH